MVFPLQTFLKESFKGVLLAGAVLFSVLVLSNIWVLGAARNGIVSTGDAPKSQVVMVFGASVLRNGKPSDILADRLLTALELYRAGKAEKILLSGDNGQRDYDEVNVMKAYLLERGVPGEDIFLDHAGFDSYDSMYRAKHIFGADDMLLVTQRFHLPRVIYLARALNLDVYGVIADKHTYRKIQFFTAREWLARVKAVLDIVLQSKPTYLGNTISLEESGMVTWD